MPFPDCIVFQGGGALTMSYLHPLRILETEAVRTSSTIRDLCKEYRGVSAGSIAAVYMTLGFSTYRIEQLCREMFHHILGDTIFDLETFLTQRGGKNSAVIRDAINAVIIAEYGKDCVDISFQELFERTGVSLRVYAAEINCEDPGSRQFSHESTPDMPVALAVAASCAIPFLFTPVFFKGKLYVDGNTGIDQTLENIKSTQNVIVLSVYANIESNIKMSFQGYIECIINLLLSSMRKVHDMTRRDRENVCLLCIQSELTAKAIMEGSSQNVDKIIAAGAQREITETLLQFLGVRD